MQKIFSNEDWMPRMGPINWEIDFEDLKIIALDTSIIGKSHGHLENISLDFLKSCLSSAKENQSLLLPTIHQYLLE